MNADQETILMIKGLISELSPDQAEAANEVAEHIRRVVKQAGPPRIIALTLVGAEMQAEEGRT